MNCDFCGEKEYNGRIGREGYWDAHGRRTKVRARIVLEVCGPYYEMQIEIKCCKGCWIIARGWHMSLSCCFGGIEHIARCIRSRIPHQTKVTLPNGKTETICTHTLPGRGMSVVIPKMYPEGYTQAVNGELREKRFIFISSAELIPVETWRDLHSQKIQNWWKSVKDLPRKWRPRRAALIKLT